MKRYNRLSRIRVYKKVSHFCKVWCIRGCVDSGVLTWYLSTGSYLLIHTDSYARALGFSINVLLQGLMSDRNCVTYSTDGEILFKENVFMPFSAHNAMKTQEELHDPQNAVLTLPRKYIKIPALFSRCSAVSNGPGEKVFWSIHAMVLLSISKHSAVEPTIGHNCFFTDRVRFIT